jgi:steroid 5-alpha reductase family enzyme
MEKKTDSKFIGAGVWSILFTIMGIVGLMTNKNVYGYLIYFAIGGLSLIYLLYLLNKTKQNKNERYEDERKKYISEKSSSMSFRILFAIIVIFQFIIGRNYIVIDSSLLLAIITCIALLINFGTYLFCKYKY